MSMRKYGFPTPGSFCCRDGIHLVDERRRSIAIGATASVARWRAIALVRLAALRILTLLLALLGYQGGLRGYVR
jgi:hypothetical protein